MNLPPRILFSMDIKKKCFDDINVNELFKVAFYFHLNKATQIIIFKLSKIIPKFYL
jgi:hypothetical protein